MYHCSIIKGIALAGSGCDSLRCVFPCLPRGRIPRLQLSSFDKFILLIDFSNVNSELEKTIKKESRLRLWNILGQRYIHVWPGLYICQGWNSFNTYLYINSNYLFWTGSYKCSGNIAFCFTLRTYKTSSATQWNRKIPYNLIQIQLVLLSLTTQQEYTMVGLSVSLLTNFLQNKMIRKSPTNPCFVFHLHSIRATGRTTPGWNKSRC